MDKKLLPPKERTYVYVVTNPEDGWDCVCGVYTSEDIIPNDYRDENQYVIHREVLYTS